MASIGSVRVTVPATTANLGPGFDCIGAALGLYNQFRFAVVSSSPTPLTINVAGPGAERVATDVSNLAYQSFVRCYEQMQQPVPAIQLDIEMDVPLARGLGSSATAIVAGLVGANVLAGSPLTLDDLMQMAIAIEGHPDNVVPALIGGCRLAVADGSSWAICDIPWHETIVPILAVPNFELSTAEARGVLPQTYSRADAIFNMAHLGLLLRALELGQADWLRVALADRIHQPYRQSLIHGYDAVYSAAIAAGAHGLVISGAGPTLLALAHPGQAPDVATAIASSWGMAGIAAQVKTLQLNRNGTTVEIGDRFA